MLSVYVETTIPSYYHTDRRGAQAAVWRERTRQWWDIERHAYRLVTSAVVEIELRRSASRWLEDRVSLLDGVPRIEVDERVLAVAAEYERHKLMPAGESADALHVAAASVHSVDVVLTWNCRHLANANKLIHLRTINTRLGLSVPMLLTPYNLPREQS